MDVKQTQSPGGDSLPSERQKTFTEQLIPPLESSFHFTLNYGELPPSWNEAVTVIPEGKSSDTRSVRTAYLDHEGYHRLNVIVSVQP